MQGLCWLPNLTRPSLTLESSSWPPHRIEMPPAFSLPLPPRKERMGNLKRESLHLVSIISYITLKLSRRLGPEKLRGIHHCAEPGDVFVMPSLVLHLVRGQHRVKVTPNSLCRTSPCGCPEATPSGHTQRKHMASLSRLFYELLSKKHQCSCVKSKRVPGTSKR